MCCFRMYECNSKCSCNLNTCYNRVVQHGLTVRLELFKTELKGWGVRALDYIPGGTFICNYSGELLTDKSAIMVNFTPFEDMKSVKKNDLVR